MPRFAANLSMMFTESPFLDRFSAARRAGFDAVEFLFPYAYPAAEIAARLDEHGLEQGLFNLPPGDWDNGERGTASLAGRDAEFDRSVETALEYAEALKCRTLHVMAGIPPTGDRERAFDRYVASLQRAAPLAASAGVTLVLEPINARDMPGYLVSRTDDARRAIELVGAPNIGLQLDLYHRQIMEGDLARAIRDNTGITRHVQIAGPPERHEPDTGEVAFPYLFDVLDGTGYAGFVGCEYRPRGRTVDGLGWFGPYRR
jgi:hydroxypyruvate isomerase